MTCSLSLIDPSININSQFLHCRPTHWKSVLCMQLKQNVCDMHGTFFQRNTGKLLHPPRLVSSHMTLCSAGVTSRWPWFVSACSINTRAHHIRTHAQTHAHTTHTRTRTRTHAHMHTHTHTRSSTHTNKKQHPKTILKLHYKTISIGLRHMLPSSVCNHMETIVRFHTHGFVYAIVTVYLIRIFREIFLPRIFPQCENKILIVV